MRPDLLAWAAQHGVPVWLVPSYWVLAGLAALFGAEWHRRWAKRDRADADAEASAQVWGYVGALSGGFLYEMIRHLPSAISQGRGLAIFAGGRAAYGGLLFGLLFSAIALHRKRAWSFGFFDRVTLALGTAFIAVRTGCFLSGCDYGHVTAGPLGVRFPADSLAAADHLGHGWIPVGARSLPVHATQLYEVLVAILATAVCWAILRWRTERDGVAFATWMGLYAIGRFVLEFWRADLSRGHYASISTAQWTSIGILVVLAVAATLRISHRDREIESKPLLTS
jgi:phosphatidylglycerol:prolipoprotein diacylglycerol transferase